MIQRTWPAPATELAQCHRCGKTVKVPFGSKAHGRSIFCSVQCKDWHYEDLRYARYDRQNARKAMSFWARREMLRQTPMHMVHPGMLDVLERVQSWRPSYAEWVSYRRPA